MLRPVAVQTPVNRDDFRADVERAIAGSPVTAAVPMVTADRTQMLTPVQAAAATGYEPMYDTERPRRRRGAGTDAGLYRTQRFCDTVGQGHRVLRAEEGAAAVDGGVPQIVQRGFVA